VCELVCTASCLYLHLGQLTDDQVDGEYAQPGDDAVNELEAGVMMASSWRRVQQLYQSVLDDRHEGHEQAEQNGEEHGRQRRVVATVVTDEPTVGHEGPHRLAVLGCL